MRTSPILLLIAFLGLVGCSTTGQRNTYNTVAAIGATVDAAFKAYCDGVTSRSLPGDDLPKIARMYDEFQLARQLAITIARFAPDQPPPVDLLQKATEITTAITLAKGAKL